VPGGSEQAAGRVTIYPDLRDGWAEVSYWVLPAARRQGLAVSAVEAVTRWAFDDLGLHRLVLEHSVHNEASCRVAGRTDFELEGTLRRSLLHADGWHDVHLHARLAPDAGRARVVQP
jgi:[ribosomal protein S5]-alanine N-acetyltransferase